jgi:hypothetical protein
MEAPGRQMDPSYRFILPEGFRKDLAKMEWESLAQFASDLNFQAHKGRKETEEMARELELSKLVLLEHISHAKHRAPPAKLLVKTVKLLERCEMLAKRHSIDLSDFALFLTIVIEKMKNEKLIVYAPKPRPQSASLPHEEEGFSHFKEMVEKTARAQKQA